ncbi:hypothetical protein SLEP1_g45966 [Rubroshorea leprosula]|uniref:Uncharacterized protein n=1 Tax=Rubroshorea leprosula TaxID=152421 RepID=A0AAV5LLG4_9ROSI|nr:hypothetical protein SLEP1_g45966 [Rubroshorea leprosula]
MLLAMLFDAGRLPRLIVLLPARRLKNEKRRTQKCD